MQKLKLTAPLGRTWWSVLLVVMTGVCALALSLLNLALPVAQKDSFFMIALFTLLYFLVLYYLTVEARFSSPLFFLIAAGVILLSLALRYACLTYRSADYNSFLGPWVEYFRLNGGFSAISHQLGDYNMPYLYLLAAFSYLPVNDLYLIKLVSIIADFVLALYAMRIVSLFNSRVMTSLLTFTTVLLLPTVWLNSALWGQCDSVYTLFVVMFVYYALRNRPILAVSLLALAFSFKLQTIFFIPAVLVLLIMKKVKLRHLLAFPAVYFVTILPALLMGKPLIETFTIYTNQVGSYSDYLTLNAPTIFALVSSNAPSAIFSFAGIVLTAVLLLLGAGGVYLNREKLSCTAFIHIALICCLGMVYFLPSMHERYFFIADILAVIYAYLYPKRFFVPIIMLVGSYAGYHAYLMGEFIISMRQASLLLLLLLVQLVASLVRDFANPSFVLASQRLDPKPPRPEVVQKPDGGEPVSAE